MSVNNRQGAFLATEDLSAGSGKAPEAWLNDAVEPLILRAASCQVPQAGSRGLLALLH